MISEENHSGVLFFLVGLVALVMAGVTMSMLADSTWVHPNTTNKSAVQAGQQEITRLRIRMAELEYRRRQPRANEDHASAVAGIEEDLEKSRAWAENLNQKKTALQNEVKDLEGQVRQARLKR
jgi:peptidoglycan hydrolase CwlO-like protein